MNKAYLLAALTGVLLLSICVIGYFLYRSRKQQAAGSSSVTGLKLDKKDALIMGAMTLLYLCAALFNLGSLNVPETSWKPVKAGESLVIDLGKDYDVDRFYYYGGLGEGKFRLEYLNNANSFTPMTSIDKKDIFVWKYVRVNAKTSKLRLIIDTPGATLNEIGVFEKGSKTAIPNIKITDSSSSPADIGKMENLIDEHDSLVYTPSFMNGMYFDEIYHARTAFEHLNLMEPFEWTHPPLGKLLISIGVAVFGMNPFGWRIMGTLFGAAMIPLMYAFGLKLFEKKFYAFCAAFLIMFDFMHFTQTRIATIDVYGTFFVILMYYYMYDYYTAKSYQIGFTRSLLPLFLSGLFFGIGAASKWIAIYGGAGLAVLFFHAKFQEYHDYVKISNNRRLSKKPAWVKDFVGKNLFGTLLACIIFFVVIPAAIYTLSYIPFLLVPGPGHGFKNILNYQQQILMYHSKLTATHPFSSWWYQWPIMYKPTWFYGGQDLPAGRASTIVTMGNPAIWWFGIIAVFWAARIAILKKDKKILVVFVAMAFQYLPWIFVSRITWIYHFFSTVPFVILSIVYVFKDIIEKSRDNRYTVYAYLGVVALLFIWFYPALSGLEVSREYINSLKWFRTWVF